MTKDVSSATDHPTKDTGSTAGDELKWCIHCNKTPKWETVIGAEIRHRLFCGCQQFTDHSTDWHTERSDARKEWAEINFEGFGY